MPTPAAVFHRDGDLFVPTELARGPWSADAQHGGAPAALLARAIELVEPGPTFVARLTSVGDPEWLTPEQANIVIESLKQWKERVSK